MSRIGKLPVTIPAKVNLAVKDGVVTVKGPKGELSERMPQGVVLDHAGDTLSVAQLDDSRMARSAHGLARTLVANMVQGVTEGYTKTLVINGVGYKAEAKSKGWILFTLGYSHPILFELPAGVTAEINSNAKEPTVTLSGPDKRTIGATAAEIRGLRAPEPYKGKGIRYSDEVIRRKEGKAAGK